jgi:rhodanese-related sulfurtransferase
MSLPFEISAGEVKAILGSAKPPALIDVREPAEVALAAIENAELIPMNTVPQSLQRLEALADDGLLIVFCHHGVRSLNVVSWLRRQGVENCQSMAGGIDVWSMQVDPRVPRY